MEDTGINPKVSPVAGLQTSTVDWGSAGEILEPSMKLYGPESISSTFDELPKRFGIFKVAKHGRSTFFPMEYISKIVLYRRIHRIQVICIQTQTR